MAMALKNKLISNTVGAPVVPMLDGLLGRVIEILVLVVVLIIPCHGAVPDPVS